LFYNALGAATTSVALVIIVLAKFTEGAWMTVVVTPAVVLLLHKIHSHYERIRREVQRPLALQLCKLTPPAVIIPINCWNRVSEKAVRVGLLVSDDIVAVHVSTEEDDPARLKQMWAEKVEKPAREAHVAVPRLEIIESPYRQVYEPILAFVDKTRKAKPDRLLAVVIPELVEPHWYEYLLHNQYGAELKRLIYQRGDERTVVIDTPWYLRDV
jgi:hypothetical protein